MWNPVKEAEKAAKKVVDKIINPAANSAKSLVNRAGDEAKKNVRKVGSEIESNAKKVGHAVEEGVEKAGRDAEDGLRKAAEEVQDTFEERLPDLVEDVVMEKLPDLAEDAVQLAMSEALHKSIKKGLDTALDIVEILQPDSFTLMFGAEAALIVQVEFVVSLSFPNPLSKLTEIRKWANSPPTSRAKIMECIKDFGPEGLSVKAKVSGNGYSAGWSGSDKYDKVDAFLAKQGIN